MNTLHTQDGPSDTKRLDWWIKLTRYHRTVRVYECETPKGEKYWCCELTQPYERFRGANPREAIDAARGPSPDPARPVPDADSTPTLSREKEKSVPALPTKEE